MKTIAQLITERITEEQTNYTEFRKLRDCLIPLEGKVADGRTLSAKRLPEGYELKNKYGMMYICKAGRKNNDFLLCHLFSDKIIRVSEFERHNAWAGIAALERIEKMQALDVRTLEDVQYNLAHHFYSLCKIFKIIEDSKLDSFNNPIYYDMLRNVYNENEQDNLPDSAKIRLSDFYYLRSIKGE